MNIIDEVFYIKKYIEKFYSYLNVNETIFQGNFILICCSNSLYFTFDPETELIYLQDESYNSDDIPKNITIEYQAFKRKCKINEILS